ncbi:hypothetical protein M6I34_16365 [Burkholderiaceae bacterium FT117]|uniref:hypothetical protein n=1 Tax=Zeimonas sediminis TaxID=2944268 RepID=UPI002343068A|nr:hypothetical protein [Zeimonas sediminis]MCM5572092.1 hypothetical protein [Zeimonas sediminis]
MLFLPLVMIPILAPLRPLAVVSLADRRRRIVTLEVSPKNLQRCLEAFHAKVAQAFRDMGLRWQSGMEGRPAATTGVRDEAGTF